MQKNFQLKNNKVIPNLIWNLPLKPFMGKQQTAGVEDPETSSGIADFINDNNVRGRSPITSLGDDGLCFYERKTARGFTLIELLVVVLIIGILAAVALPQYQFAVAKARATELITTANSIVQAQERYYLANNTYTDQLENLDIDFPQANKDGGHLFITLYLAQATFPDLVKVEDNRLKDIFLMFGYPHTSWDSWKGARYCYALKTNDLANKLCAHIANNSAKDDNGGGHWMYKMQ